MNKALVIRLSSSLLDNLKSKIQNLKWGGVAAIALTFTLFGAGAEAQQPKKVPRIGFLSALSPPPVTSSGNLEAFREGLRALGWVEGENIAIEYRWAEGKFDRFPDLASELVRQRVDLILTNAPPAALAAKRASSTIPIVFQILLGDPVSIGLVASLARPGGNLTGLAGLGPELSSKQVELLKEVVPRLARLGLLANPSNEATASTIRATEIAAQSLGVRLQVLKVAEPDKLDGAFSAMMRERANALMVLADPMFAIQRKRLLGLVEKARLPAIYVETPWVPAGGLMSYSPSLPEQFRQAATYVDKILKGTKPADLPVEQPTKFEFIINLKTAKQIGLTIPQSVLYRADRVIK